jgi:hypothetical protein
MKSKYNINSLPKWAQEIILSQDTIIKRQVKKIQNEQLANRITADGGYSWYTLGVGTPESRKLYIFDRDHPRLIGTFGDEVIFMVAYPNRNVHKACTDSVKKRLKMLCLWILIMYIIHYEQD